MKSNLKKVEIIIVVCFLIVLLALGNLQLLKRTELTAHPRNRYDMAIKNKIVRGNIYDRNGKPLAITVDDGQRQYPLNNAASNLIGYSSKTLGKAGVERWFDQSLSGQDGLLGVSNTWRRLAGSWGVGYDLQLTIDSQLQELGFRLLNGRRGAVVALDPNNGELLALISSPGFEMKDLEENWSNYIEDPNKPLFNRAISGAYPPGSTFKPVVGAAALDFNFDFREKEFFCPGYIEVEGRLLNCSKAHGEISLIEGIALSCNVVFAELGLEVGEERLREKARSFGLIDPAKEGFQGKYFSLGSSPMTKNALAETAIGQGQVLTSPLQMAMVAAAIGNNGLLVQPFLLKGLRLPDEEFKVANKIPIKKQIMSVNSAQVLKEGMAATVNWGTGWQAKLPETEVGGKTGSAENPHGKTHAWFIAFAPVEKPLIAIAVVVENAGTGGGQGAPIAKEMIDFYLNSR